jgi:hypothetical protein
MELQQIVQDLATAFKEVDSCKPQGRSKTRIYRPGVGPLTEKEAIRLAVERLVIRSPEAYAGTTTVRYPQTRQECDLVIPRKWAIELKLLRPFGDNGVEAEHWSENILHPYEGDTSTIGDCLKLIGSGFQLRKAVIVFAYEHRPPRVDISVAVEAFELISTKLVGLVLGSRITAEFVDLVHPCHQQGKVFGWEVLGREHRS